MSAADSTRSSLALGQDDVPPARLGALEQLVLEHHRRSRRRPWQRDSLRQLARIDAGLEDADRGGDPGLVLGRSIVGLDGVHGGRRPDRCARPPAAPGNGASGSSAAKRRAPARSGPVRTTPATAGSAGKALAARLASTMSARSPGTITSVPSTEVLEEVLDAHRRHPDRAHLAVELAVAPARTSAPSSVATCDTVGCPSAGSSASTYSGSPAVVDDRVRAHVGQQLARDAVDDHAEQRAPLRASAALATRTAEAIADTDEPLTTTSTGQPSCLASVALSSKSRAGSVRR